jgi:hypothetical protein
MQTRQHEDMFDAQLERYEGADKAASSEPNSGENGAGEGELRRYEEEEIVTKPWPPLHW